MNPECVFCQIIQRDEYDSKSDGVVRFKPINPVTPGHMLFVPTHHSTYPLNDPYWTGKAFEAAARYGQFLNGQFNLIVNCGPDASQTIHHTHIHYIPRHKDDGLILPWTEQQRHARSTDEPTHPDSAGTRGLPPVQTRH